MNTNYSEIVKEVILNKKSINEYNLKFKEKIYISNELKKRKKLIDKFPEWGLNFELLLPNLLNIEQSSSEKTAEYKSKIINYNNILDLTGGFGIDSYFFSKRAEKLYFNEKNFELFYISKKNFEKLNIKNVEFFNYDAVEFLKYVENKFDLIYLDPSRRDNHNKKIIRIEEYDPNLDNLLEYIKNKSDYLLLKTSPLLDINYVLKKYQYIRKVIVISLENEVKELLFLFDFINTIQKIEYIAVLINQNITKEIYLSKDKSSINYSLPEIYLYEPDPAIMKLSFFGDLCNKYNLNKLEKNTHLFTNNCLNIDFPGNIYEIKNIVKIDEKELKKTINNENANLKVRNLPIKTIELKKKLKINDGGNYFVFATKLLNGKNRLIICNKVNR